MKTYRITDIVEDEFGCEGRPEGEEPMVTIILVDDDGKQRSIRMADKLAYEKELDVGVEMELPEEKQASVKAATRMLKMGSFSLEQIAEISGLSVNEIKELAE